MGGTEKWHVVIFLCLTSECRSEASREGYRRPVVIVQSDKENLNNLNTTVVVPLTSNTVHADKKGNVFSS